MISITQSDNSIIESKSSVLSIAGNCGAMEISGQEAIAIIATEPGKTIITQGGRGPSGASAEYTTRSDIVGDGAYFGEAAPGSIESEAVWKICFSDFKNVTKKWANGKDTKINKWTDRLILTYN
jgi:hypothetical protein